jgi:uncharacterized protein
MKNKVITSKEEKENIIRKCRFCNLAMVDENNEPYVIPMNFGYRDGCVYLHSSKKGKKIEILKRKNLVCISFSTDHELRWQSEQIACSYSMKYRSVLVYGKVQFIEEPENKTEALNIIMRQYTGVDFTYNKPAIKEVAVYKVVVEKMDGRIYGY